MRPHQYDYICYFLLYCNQPYCPTTRFWSPLSHMVSAQPFPDKPRPMSCKSAQMGSCPITFLWLLPATDHEPHSRHVSTNKIRRQTETTPRRRWWRSHMAGINSDHSIREMKTFNHCLKCTKDKTDDTYSSTFVDSEMTTVTGRRKSIGTRMSWQWRWGGIWTDVRRLRCCSGSATYGIVWVSTVTGKPATRISSLVAESSAVDGSAAESVASDEISSSPPTPQDVEGSPWEHLELLSFNFP